jgi:hypothetical protein
VVVSKALDGSKGAAIVGSVRCCAMRCDVMDRRRRRIGLVGKRYACLYSRSAAFSTPFFTVMVHG